MTVPLSAAQPQTPDRTPAPPHPPSKQSFAKLETTQFGQIDRYIISLSNDRLSARVGR